MPTVQVKNETDRKRLDALKRAEKGSPEAVAELRRLLPGDPAISEALGNLAQHAHIASSKEAAGKFPAVAAAMQDWAAQLAERIDLPPLVILLANPSLASE